MRAQRERQIDLIERARVASARIKSGANCDPGALADILDGLNLTGHFLERVAFAATHSPLPAARVRFVESYGRLAAESAIPAA